MRSGLRLAMVGLVAACASGGETPAGTALAPGDHEITLRHDGRVRRYHVHVPAAATAAARPLVLAFHGGGGHAEGYREYANLDALSDREGFVAVYPDGTGPLRSRLLTWNAGTCCGQASDRAVDDVGFVMALLDDLSRRTPIDQRRIYATGHSNGAMMAYRLAAERADRIAAIVPVAGAMVLETFAPARGVPVLHIHSVDDPRAPYEGGIGPPFPLTNRRVSHRPVREALDRWIATNGCPPAPTVLETRSGRPGSADAAHTATRQVWAPCRDGAEVAHWRLTGAGHGWPGNARAEVREALIGPATTVIDAATEVWAFASRFVLR